MIDIVDHGTVRELRLARPPVNALSPDLIAALSQALDAAAAATTATTATAATTAEGAASAAGDAGGAAPAALVLSGSPGMFSAGLDVPLLLTLDRDGIRRLWLGLYDLLRRLAASPLPVIAAITGHSPAGGAVMALFCDQRIMAAGDYRIGLNEVQVGLPMPPVILQAMRRLVGARLAERLCVGALLVPAAEAARIGLVDELAAPEEVVPRAIAIARELAALPRTAMTETRRQARADLCALFAPTAPSGTAAPAGTAESAAAGPATTEVDAVLDTWFSAEAQGTMRALVERLAARKRG